MNVDAQIGHFEVTSHYELTGRGAFIIGRIRGGVIRPGMYVDTHGDPPMLKVASVEFLDNIAEKTHQNALVFAEQPSMAFVKAAFPIGSLLELRADKFHTTGP
jgi:hypothetical protein